MMDRLALQIVYTDFYYFITVNKIKTASHNLAQIYNNKFHPNHPSILGPLYLAREMGRYARIGGFHVSKIF